ncbi:unnamed protein product [Rangifer tarandus platyrhynchus]|uniref:Uncharacterized protein n=2 Tax=Rangifer tarandus platyrhynchus TaxID=3082113 RepID=A0AC59YAM3_RANTA|nr:unnamed protein product [Rangifer tarandus platyrhynchus]
MKGHADCPRQKVPDKYQGQTSTNQQPIARQTDGRDGAKTPANQEKPTRDKRPISTLEPDSKRIRKGPAASVSARVYRCRPPSRRLQTPFVSSLTRPREFCLRATAQ